MRLPALWLVLGVIGFGVLVTANSAGYRYGVSDQAYYVPAILAKVTPGLFPRDTAMFESQGRFSVFDEVLASLVEASGVSLPALFLAGYVATVVLFAWAAWLVAASIYRSAWSSAALLAALSLRHQVLGTGVNSFEGYFHPRVLAFAIGLLALAAVLRERRLLACIAAALALVVHPTTGAWFAAWVGVALVAEARVARWRVALPVALALGLAAALVGASALRGSFVVMDPPWLEAIGAKRYLFPNTWAAGTWIANALAPALVAGVFAWRAHTGRAVPAERGLVVGCLALFAAFLLSVPFIAAHLAIAVQLQTSRALWQVELLATVYVIWMAVDLPLASGARVARTVVVLLVAASASRGVYILAVQFHRPLVRVGLVEDDWRRMAAWAERGTPPAAGFLVDPQHVGRYGVSFRVAAARDVFLEAVKDAAMATYSRDVALEVAERQRALDDFDALTAERALALAARYDLDVMVSERRLSLPELHREGRFVAYAIGPRALAK